VICASARNLCENKRMKKYLTAAIGIAVLAISATVFLTAGKEPAPE